MTTSSSSLKKILYTLPVAAFWWGVWEMAALWVGSHIILVPPRMAFARLFVLMQTGDFWLAIGTSMGRIMTGFFLALAAGMLIAVGAAASKIFHRLMLPAVNVLNAMPLASFVLLILFMFNRQRLSIVVPFVMVLPIIFHNVYKGIKNTDADLLEMAQVFGVPFRRKIRFIYVKSVMPFFLSAASIGIGFAWKSGISAELIGVARGTIGGHLHRAQIGIQSVDIFAWTIAIVALSYGLDRGIKGLVRGLGG